MTNGSFAFGMDGDGEDVFDRTVDWVVPHGITTATFHVQTPCPGAGLHRRPEAQGRITARDWDLYGTRHAACTLARMTERALEAGCRRACHDFCRSGRIAPGASAHARIGHRARHLAHAGGWKRLEPMCDLAVRTGGPGPMRPALERVLSRASDR